MTRTRSTFRQSDITRVLKAARAAGVDIRVEIEPSGKIVIIPMKDAATNADSFNEWDEVLSRPVTHR